MFTFTSPIWFDGHAVERRARACACTRAIAVRLRRARPAGEVVALVDGDDEQRVLLVDPVVLRAA